MSPAALRLSVITALNQLGDQARVVCEAVTVLGAGSSALDIAAPVINYTGSTQPLTLSAAGGGTSSATGGTGGLTYTGNGGAGGNATAAATAAGAATASVANSFPKPD